MTRKLPAPRTIVELFAAGNLAFLAVDVYVAHSVNAFERGQEWIPIALSVIAPVLLGVGWATRRAHVLGLLVGWAAVLVGVAGMLLHLGSHFFEEQTIRNLVYTAPFIAPLAYTGIGMLLILNRSDTSDAFEWARWIVFLALGGFVGNFVLALADHAQNGFFNPAEWISVAASALAIGCLLMMVLRAQDDVLLRVNSYVLVLEVLVGVLGFGFHLRANLSRPGEHMWGRFIYGAPIFAPLLFANLAILASIGLWAIYREREPALEGVNR